MLHVLMKGTSLHQIYRKPVNLLQRFSVPIKTLLFSIFRRISMHCVLSSGTQRCAALHWQSDEIKILNITFSRVGIKATSCRVYTQARALLQLASLLITEILLSSYVLVAIKMFKNFYKIVFYSTTCSFTKNVMITQVNVL